MKNNLSTVVLAIGLAVLYILHFSSSSESSDVGSDSIEVQDSSKSDSTDLQVINTADSSFMDSLEIAEYSKVGYLDIAKVVQMCPLLKKDQVKLVNAQKSIKGKQIRYENELQRFIQGKEIEFNNLQKSGLLTQSNADRIQQEVGAKQNEHQSKMISLNKEFNASKEDERRLSETLDFVIGKGLEVINERVKLDYILIEKRELSTVYALNKKNDITDAMIKWINVNGVK